MFNIVLQQMIEDQLRSTRVICYSIYFNRPIYGSIEELYKNFMETWEGDPNDITLAPVVTDGIYQLIPQLIAIPI